MRLIAADEIATGRCRSSDRIVTAEKINAQRRVTFRGTEVSATDTKAANVVTSNGVTC